MALRVEIRVQPRASKNSIERDCSGRLKLRLTAPPVEGEANKAALRFLAEYLGVSTSRVRLVRGETSRTKLFEIDGLDSFPEP